jgi:hypothetical protein
MIGLDLLFGLGVGYLMGLTGAGGGVLALPALTIGLGMALPDAIPIALIAVGSAACMGAVHGLRQGLVRYRAAALMATVGCLTSPLGLWMAHQLPQQILIVIFCSVMTVVAVRMFKQGRSVSHSPRCGPCLVDKDTGRFKWGLPCFKLLAGIGATAGFFTGLLGVGGGFIAVPALRQFSDLSIQSCATTSLAMVAVVSAVTAFATLSFQTSIASIGWVFISAAIVGMAVGRATVQRIPGHMLQYGFSALVAATALLWLGLTFR